MDTWTPEELKKMGSAEELQFASLRQDGTLRPRVTIWVVRVGDDLFVRSVKGRAGPWFRGVQTRHAGRVWAGGIEKDVSFIEQSDPDLNLQIDAAYRQKYRRYSANIVNSILTLQARASTLKLAPRS